VEPWGFNFPDSRLGTKVKGPFSWGDSLAAH
jgi:hypothetical protein